LGLLLCSAGVIAAPESRAQIGLCGDGIICNIPGCTSGPGGGPEECDAGAQNSDVEPDACRTNCARAHCGDGVVDRTEACDDGEENGVQCPADCRRCQTNDQQKCINAINKRASKVAATQGKVNVACVKDAVKGKLSVSASQCFLADPKGKVARAEQKTLDDQASKCVPAEEPDFAYSGAERSNEAAIEEEQGLMNDLFGQDPGGALPAGSPSGGCQTKVVQRAEKILAAKMKEFLRCKRGGLKDGTICAPPDLEACMDVVREDAKGKVGKTIDQLRADVARECPSVDIATAFPGLCAGAEDLASCVDEQVECRMCRMVNGMDGLHADCDLFDDGLPNGSCGGVPPTPTPTLLSTFTPTPTPTPTIMCGNSPLLVDLATDPILVQYGANAGVTANGSPAPSGFYRNWLVRNQDFDAEVAWTGQPSCFNQPGCENVLNAPTLSLPLPRTAAKVCGFAEAEVSFRCIATLQDATDTARVELGCGGRSAADCVVACGQEAVQGQCGTPCSLIGVEPPPYRATTGTCWKVNVNGTDYCYWDHKTQNAPGFENLCCPNRCYGASFVVWGQGFGNYVCTVSERCDDNPEFAGSECVDATGT
jgi:hypothetical protein